MMDLDEDPKVSLDPDQDDGDKDDLFCDVCKISYSQEQEFRDHAWSLMHHIKVEQKNKGSTHNCTLCFATCPNIIEYGKHLNGNKHKRAAEEQRHQMEKETMTFEKEALLNKRVKNEDDGKLPGEHEYDGNISDPVMFRQYKTPRHKKAHQRSLSQPNIRGKQKGSKGKGKKSKDNGSKFQPKGNMPRYPQRAEVPQGRESRDMYWDNLYVPGLEGDGEFIPQSNWEGARNFHDDRARDYRPEGQRDFNALSQWDKSWWEGNEYLGQDQFSFSTDYRPHRQPETFSHGPKQHGKKHFGGNLYHSNERYGSNQEHDKYHWSKPFRSDRQYRNRPDRNWDYDQPTRDFSTRSSENWYNQSGGDLTGHMVDVHEMDPEVDSDITGVKRRRSSDDKDTSSSSRKTSNIPSQKQRNSVSIDCNKDNGSSVGVHPDKRYKSGSSVVHKEPDSTTEGTDLDKRLHTNKGKKKEKGKKKKGGGAKAVEVSSVDFQESSVLEKAEQLCKELRDKRQLAKKEREKKERQKKMEKTEEINSQIKSLSDINQGYLRGHISGCYDQMAAVDSENLMVSGLQEKRDVTAKMTKEHAIDDIRMGIESVVKAEKQLMKKKEMKSKEKDKGKTSPEVNNVSSKSGPVDSSISESVEDENISREKSPIRGPSSSLQDYLSHTNTVSTVAQENLSRQSSRASSDMSAELDPELSSKDTLLKMVNSPRSRKERDCLAKMLRSYACSQNKLSLPRFNLQLSDLTSELDGIATELRLEDLSANVQLQIAQLIEADIKPDLSSLESLVLQTQGETTGETSLPDFNTSIQNESVMGHSPAEISTKSPKGKARSGLRLGSPNRGLFSSPSNVEDKDSSNTLKSRVHSSRALPNRSETVCVKTEELSEPERDVSPPRPEPVLSKNKRSKDKSDTTYSRDKSEPVYMLSKNKQSKDMSETTYSRDKSEPVTCQNKTEHERFRDGHGSIDNSGVKFGQDRGKEKPKSVWSIKEIESKQLERNSEPMSTREKYGHEQFRQVPEPQQSTSERRWSKGKYGHERLGDKSKSSWSRDKSELTSDHSGPILSRIKIEPDLLDNYEANGSSKEPRKSIEVNWSGELSVADLLSADVSLAIPELDTTNNPGLISDVSKHSAGSPWQPSGQVSRLEPLSQGLGETVRPALFSMDPIRPGVGLNETRLPVTRPVEPDRPGLGVSGLPALGAVSSAHTDDNFPASLSSSTSESVFDLVFDLSVEEDGLRKEMSSAESEITRLTVVIQRATEQLGTQRTRHQQLARKEESLRNRRLHVLREAKSLQNSSSESLLMDRLMMAPPGGSSYGVLEKNTMRALTPEISDSSKNSSLTKVSNLSEPKTVSRTDSLSDSHIVLSDSSDSSRQKLSGFSSPVGLKTKKVDRKVFQALPPPLEPRRAPHVVPSQVSLRQVPHVDPGRDNQRQVSLVDPNKATRVTDVESIRDTVRQAPHADPGRDNLRQAPHVDPNKATRVADVDSSRDTVRALESTRVSSQKLKGQCDVDLTIPLTGSAELKETGFVTLKSLQAKESSVSQPEREYETLSDSPLTPDNKTSPFRLALDDRTSKCTVSSTTAEFVQPKVTEASNSKVNFQYMGHLPGNLLTEQKEKMYEKLQSFFKGHKAEQGYRSESSFKSDEIIIADTDSNRDSARSNISLGEQIRQYCKEYRRDSTHGVDSGSDRTLKGASNSEANTPNRQQSKPPVSPPHLDDGNSSPSRKRRKTKKERDLSSKRKQKEEYVINSSSEYSGQDDDNIPLVDLRKKMIFQPEAVGNLCDSQRTEDDVCMVETGSDDHGDRTAEPRHSLLAEVQLDSANESEDCDPQGKSQRFKLGPDVLASMWVSVKNSLNKRSAKQQTDSSVQRLIGPTDLVTHIQVAGDCVFVAYQKSNPCRFSLETGTLLGQYDCSPCYVRSIAMVTINNSLCLYACGPSERLFLFNCETRVLMKDMELIYQVQYIYVAWGRLFLGTDYGAVISKDAKTGRTLESFQCCDQSVTCISSGLEGVRKIILVAAYTSPIYVCDAMSGLLLRMLEGHSKTVFCMQVDGHLVYSGSGDRKVVEHDLLTSDICWTCEDSEGLVRGVATDKQGHLYYGGHDSYIRCYNRQNRQLHCVYYAGKSPVVSNIIVQKNKIVFGNKDGVVEIITMEGSTHQCQCGDCSYTFGLREQMYHHLISEHLMRNKRLFKCPWNGCTDTLSTHRSSQEAEEHLKGHIK